MVCCFNGDACAGIFEFCLGFCVCRLCLRVAVYVLHGYSLCNSMIFVRIV